MESLVSLLLCLYDINPWLGEIAYVLCWAVFLGVAMVMFWVVERLAKGKAKPLK